MSGRERIRLAAEATKRMDDLLDPALNDLRGALRGGNGAGVYHDVSRVRSALATAFVAVTKAQAIANKTDWPAEQDYDE
jgi:hypothetical protein